jgi:sugar lactone lactonase YvrE
VGTLALADFFASGPGTATVYRVDPKATNPNVLNTVLNVATVWATGFSTITGCTFDNHGNFYAAEMFAGVVVEAPFANPSTGRSLIGKGQLALPNGVAVDNNGAVYVSNMSDNTTAGAGSVIRFRAAGGL